MASSSIYVRNLGKGERSVLALHCTIAHSGAWAGLASCIGTQATFVAPDMLSHGMSPDWDGQSDFFDLTTALSAAQLTQPMDLIGHSFGAMIALRLAVEHPNLVRSVVLIEPVFFAVAAQDAPDLLAQHDMAAQPYVEALKAGDMPLAARLFNRMWSTDDSPRWPDMPEKTRAAMIRGIRVVPDVEQSLFQDTKGLLKPEALLGAKAPVLLMAGGNSHPVMPAIARGLQRRLPNASKVTVESAGHMLPISHPRETAAQITSFWQSLQSSSV
ncbi:alpha/beta fold hydrolase [Ruegeria lacuscaerulensis]|uniref:alpha/beta fold hydrolase n=1 Tax=Ruegeria lacuscaerulensis TaxID=55218 RepID=UPI002F268B5D